MPTENEKQLTAMSELRGRLQIFKKAFNDGLPDEAIVNAVIDKVVNLVDTELLATERQQHLDTFVAGDERGTGNIPFNAEQYFEQTFKTQ